MNGSFLVVCRTISFHVYYTGLFIYRSILTSFLSTFGVYGLMRVAQRRRWSLWRFMCRMGRISHIERKGLFLWLQKVMDWKIN